MKDNALLTNEKERPVTDRALPIVTDIGADYPVTKEELDVIESFLLNQLRHLLDPCATKQPQHSDDPKQQSRQQGRRQ